MVSTGFAIFLGLLFLLVKLPRRLMLRLLHHDLAVDVVVTLFTFAVHFGTFSGLMAATVAGVLTSATTSVAKRLFGFIKNDRYFPGIVHLEV
jgi:NhaP-type Na+/H+ or K+/H+ antiporter